MVVGKGVFRRKGRSGGGRGSV
ncbi:uncharacterized protein G2W53_029421 [Senna tora]|uniref:Uncharacterized protein n=1 Tax=Senna tora TaxID=362788 RepID=A0A834WAP5_9FABA|nr:uncharacterized protein G2W53_029421 [Senna tora]